MARTLLEREAELAALERTLEAAGDGDGSMLWIEGEAGVGKSSLLDAARRRAVGAGMRVTQADGGELEAAFSLGVAQQLLERPVADADAEERATLLSGPAGLAWQALEPAGARAAPPDDVGFSVLHGLYWLTANLAERRPVLVMVDDVHWADEPSLRFLVHMAQRLRGLSVALVVAARRYRHGPRARTLEALRDCARGARIEPAPLSGAAVAQLLARRLAATPDPRFAAACQAATAGNPLLLDALVRLITERGLRTDATGVAAVEQVAAEAARQEVPRWIERLSQDARALAQAVAVLGPRADLLDAARVAGLEHGRASQAADALAIARILRDARPLDFLHPTLRTGIYRAMHSGERARGHAAAARVLRARGASPERIATHLLRTEPAADPEVARLLLAAARQARGVAANDTATACLRRALAEPPPDGDRVELLLELGLAEAAAGELGAAIDHLGQTLAQAAAPATRARAGLALGQTLTWANRVEEAVRVMTDLSDELRGHDREASLRLESAALAAGRGHLLARPLAAQRLADRALPAGDTPAERLLLGNLAVEAVMRGEPAQRAVELARASLRGGDLQAEGPDAQVLRAVARALAIADHFEEARRGFDQALAEARRRGSLLGFAAASTFRAELCLREGDVRAALADAGDAREATRAAGGDYTTAAQVAVLVDALCEAGDLEAAAAVVDEAPGSNGYATNLLLHSRGRLHLLEHRPDAAVADLRECGRREEAWGETNPAVVPWRSSLALALLALGDRPGSRALVDEELERARAFGALRAIGIALRVRALTADRDRVEAGLREAVATLARSPAELEHARALVELGAAQRRSGRSRHCRDALRQGMDAADRLGARALAARARSELVAAGARPRRARLHGVEALTARELRVARIAEGGASNREIAQTLFVTEKTVEAHLSRAYGKLGHRLPGAAGVGTGPAPGSARAVEVLQEAVPGAPGLGFDHEPDAAGLLVRPVGRAGHAVRRLGLHREVRPRQAPGVDHRALRLAAVGGERPHAHLVLGVHAEQRELLVGAVGPRPGRDELDVAATEDAVETALAPVRALRRLALGDPCPDQRVEDAEPPGSRLPVAHAREDRAPPPWNAAPMAKTDATIVDAGGRELRVTSPDRVIFPATERTAALTKLDVVDYYLAVGDGILRALRRRPTTLERWPKGVHPGIVLSTREERRRRRVLPEARPAGRARLRPDARASSSRPAATPTRSARPSSPSSAGRRRWARSPSIPGRCARDDVDHPDELRIDLDPQPGTDFADAVRVAARGADAAGRARLRGLPEDLGRPRRAHLRADRAALDVHRRPPRGDRVRPRARAPAARAGDDQVVEGGARRAHLRRLQPERPRPHDRLGLQHPAQAGRAGVGAGDLGRAARGRARGLHRGHDARALRRRSATCTRRSTTPPTRSSRCWSSTSARAKPATCPIRPTTRRCRASRSASSPRATATARATD